LISSKPCKAKQNRYLLAMQTIFFSSLVARPVALLLAGAVGFLLIAPVKAQTMITVEPFQLPAIPQAVIRETASPQAVPRAVWRLRDAAYLDDPWHRLPANQLQGQELPRSLQVDPSPDSSQRL